jgi:hypothetical protein
MERKTHSEAFSDYLTSIKVVSLFRLPAPQRKLNPPQYKDTSLVTFRASDERLTDTGASVDASSLFKRALNRLLWEIERYPGPARHQKCRPHGKKET